VVSIEVNDTGKRYWTPKPTTYFDRFLYSLSKFSSSGMGIGLQSYKEYIGKCIRGKLSFLVVSSPNEFSIFYDRMGLREKITPARRNQFLIDNFWSNSESLVSEALNG